MTSKAIDYRNKQETVTTPKTGTASHATHSCLNDAITMKHWAFSELIVVPRLAYYIHPTHAELTGDISHGRAGWTLFYFGRLKLAAGKAKGEAS